MWIAGNRFGTPVRGDAKRQDWHQDSGAFALEHPYRSGAIGIHEIVLAWLLGDDEQPRPIGRYRLRTHPA